MVAVGPPAEWPTSQRELARRRGTPSLASSFFALCPFRTIGRFRQCAFDTARKTTPGADPAGCAVAGVLAHLRGRLHVQHVFYEQSVRVQYLAPVAREDRSGAPTLEGWETFPPFRPRSSALSPQSSLQVLGGGIRWGNPRRRRPLPACFVHTAVAFLLGVSGAVR
jgi:hypothetical protein